jgi:ATP-dependent Clp protease adaptor protein ClpS
MSQTQSTPEQDFETVLEEDLQEPRKFKVLLHNDDYTSMDFVVQILKDVFHKTDAEAVQVMMNVHEHGVGECGIYTAEVAETKVEVVHRRARKRAFPLKCTMEEV